MQLITIKPFIEDCDFNMATDAMIHVNNGHAEGFTDGYSVRLIKFDVFQIFDDGKTQIDIGWVDMTTVLLNPPNEGIECLKHSLEMQIIDEYWKQDRAMRGVDHWSELRFDTSREGA